MIEEEVEFEETFSESIEDFIDYEHASRLRRCRHTDCIRILIAVTKRYYMIREIPDKYIGADQFEAPHGWDLYCVWPNPKDGKTYGIFEKIEDV